MDESGRPRDVDAVQLVGPPVAVLAAPLGRGIYRFASFPRQARGIVASAKGHTWRVAHAAGEPGPRLVVPSSGSLLLTWGHLPPGFEPSGAFIRSDPAGWSWFEPFDAATRARRGPVRFEDLAPGRYEVRLHSMSDASADLRQTAIVTSGVTTTLRLDG